MTTAVDTAQTEFEGHPRRWWILVVMCLSLILIVAAVSSLNLALPSIRNALDASGTDLLWIVDSYALAFAGFLLPAGAIGDRYGRREALLAGMVIVLVTSIGASYAATSEALIAWRAAMGLGAALIMPATLSIITVVFPKDERSRAIAIWTAFAAAGGALGLLGGGLLLERFWWGSVFFVNVPIAAVVLLTAIAIVPTSRDSQQRSLDYAGAILSVAGLGALLFAIIEGPERGWTDPLTLAGFILAGVFIASFIKWEFKATWPMLDPRFFKIRAFSMGSVAITMVFLTMFGFFFLIIQFFQFAQGLSPLQSAVRTLPLTAVFFVVAPLSVTLAQKFGPKVTIPAGLILASVGLVLMGTIDADTSYGIIVIPIIVMAAGMAILMPPASENIVASLPQDKAGVGSAVNDTTREVGGAIGIAVMGSMLAVGYRSGLGDATEGLPPEAAELAEDSIGFAIAVAADAPPEQAETLIAAASTAFTDGMTLAFSVAAGLLVVTAAVVARWYPRKAELEQTNLAAAAEGDSASDPAPVSAD